MRRVVSHAAPFVPRMRAGVSRLRQWGFWREVQIQANGRAAWRAETMQIVCDFAAFSAADGFRRDEHAAIRREAQRQTRRDALAGRSRLDGRHGPCLSCAPRPGWGDCGHRARKAGKGGACAAGAPGKG